MIKTISLDLITHKKKIRIIYLAALFAVVFSTFFLVDRLPISPIYLTSIFAVFLAVVVYSYKRIPAKQIFVYIPIFLMASWFVIAAVFTPQGFGYARHFKDPIVFMYFAMYYILVDMLLYQVNKKELKKIVNWYFIFNFIIFALELYFRIQYGNTNEFGGWIGATLEADPTAFIFYRYKYNSIFGGDSNFAALIIFPVLIVATFLWKEKLYKNKNLFWLLVFTVFLIFTFSRSMIMSYFALFAFLIFYYKRKIFFKAIAIILLAILAIATFMMIAEDVSFLSKITLYEDLFRYFETMTVSQFFFGNGTMASEQILSFYAHNLPALFIVEYGFISFLLFLITFAIISIDVGKHSFYLFPFLLGASISYTSPYLPFLWAAFALIKHLDRLCGYKSVVDKREQNVFLYKEKGNS